MVHRSVRALSWSFGSAIARSLAAVLIFGAVVACQMGGSSPTTQPVETCSRGLTVPAGASDGLVDDCDTLLSLEHKLAGSASLNWSADVSIQDWDGVTLLDDGSRVARLDLGSMGLSGSIPPELGQLEELWDLSLYGNQLSGQIPSELGKLENLIWLQLSENSLTGPIPAELGDLASLEELHLQGNDLSGKIPSELGKLENLRWLWLSGNPLLTGCVPASLRDSLGLEESNLRTYFGTLGFCET